MVKKSGIINLYYQKCNYIILDDEILDVIHESDIDFEQKSINIVNQIKQIEKEYLSKKCTECSINICQNCSRIEITSFENVMYIYGDEDLIQILINKNLVISIEDISILASDYPLNLKLDYE